MSSVFGEGGGPHGAQPLDPFAREQPASARAAARGGADVETTLTVSLEEAYRGALRRLAFQRADPTGGVTRQSYDVKIPAGITDGRKIRMRGQGGTQGNLTGDIIITVHMAPHPRYTLEGHDLIAELALAPWEAALGGKVSIQSLDGPLEVKVPAGIGAGKRLRVRGRGYPGKGDARGDLYLRVAIQVPDKLTSRERELFEQLSKASTFNPREGA